jgi:hypothetical protein
VISHLVVREALQHAIERGDLVSLEAAEAIYADLFGPLSPMLGDEWRRWNPPCDVCGRSLAGPDRLALCEHAKDLPPSARRTSP